MMESSVDSAVARCPFLHNVCEREGQAYARSIAMNPLLPAPSRDEAVRRRPVLEEERDLLQTFRLFHGPGGAFPLASSKGVEAACAVPVPASTATSPAMLNVASAARCPFHMPSGHAATAAARPVIPDVSDPVRKHGTNPLAGAPLATLSLGMPDFGEFLRRLQQQQPKPKPKPNARRPPSNRPDIKPSATGSTSTHPGTPNISPAPPPGPVPGPAPGPAATGATCPLRTWLGPYAGLIFNQSGHIACPTPIVKARAMLAATQPVRALRPQALPIKLIAVGAIAAAANVPCGMWREHTEKFSMQWFIAVHASIPFIAMLRKAVIMPKLAIVCTIAAAIAGQAMGSRLERKRMQQAAADVLLVDFEPSAAKADGAFVQPVAAVAAMTVAGSPALSKRSEKGVAGTPKRARAFRTRGAPGSAAGGWLAVKADSTAGNSAGEWNAQSLAQALEPLGAQSGAAEWRIEGHRAGHRERQVLAHARAITVR